MADTEEADDKSTKRRSKRPLLIGLVLALLGGGGGYYAAHVGLLFPAPEAKKDEPDRTDVAPLPDIAFVPIDPLVVSLGADARSRHLRFVAQLEVVKAHEAEVTTLMPRVLDVLNGYLRAVEVGVLENPRSLIQLRAQMLRRIQIVAGEGRVRDLLVTEFVLN